MNQIYYIANKYYFAFESWKSIFFWSNWRLYTWLTSGLAFVYFAIHAFNYRLQYTTNQLLAMMPMAIFEIAFFYSSMKLREHRKRLILKSINAQTRNHYTNIDQAKKDALQKLLKTNKYEFVEKIKEIKELQSTEIGRSKPNLFTAEQIYQYIYNPEAKNRILTLLIVLATITLSLTANISERSDQVFDLLTHKGIEWLYLIFLFYFTTIALFISATFQSIPTIFAPLVIRTDGLKAKSKYTINYLIRDMAKYHKPHVRISSKR